MEIGDKFIMPDSLPDTFADLRYTKYTREKLQNLINKWAGEELIVTRIYWKDTAISVKNCTTVFLISDIKELKRKEIKNNKPKIDNYKLFGI